MRLWHEALIPYLPQKQLCGLHRECAALRGKGWGKKHATVNYVFEHPYGWLWLYHLKVIKEMKHRGYKVSQEWFELEYRGKKCSPLNFWDVGAFEEECAGYKAFECKETGSYIYPEHNDAYLKECLDNLEAKGIHIEMEVK